MLCAGLIGTYGEKLNIGKILGGKSKFTIIKGALIGTPIPLCSCSVIPVASAINDKGANKGATASFLVSSPEIGVDSFILTYSLLGPVFAYLRLFLSFVSALAAGILVKIFSSKEERKLEASSCCGCSSTQKDKKITFLSPIKYVQTKIVPDIRNALIIGLVVSAVLAAMLPNDLDFISQMPRALKLGLAALFSIPFYICSLSSTPLASVLAGRGFDAGTLIVILLLGPATNVSTMIFAKKIFGSNGVMAYLFGVTSVAFAGAIVIGYMNIELFSIADNAHNHESFGPLNYIATSILLFSFISSYLNKKL